MGEQIQKDRIIEKGNANSKVNFALRLSLIDGSIEVDPSLREITFEDLKQFMPKEGVIFDGAKNKIASVKKGFDGLGR